MREMSRSPDANVSALWKDGHLTTEVERACSRCESPLDTTGSPKWCKACRAKNQREYMALRKEMAESRGFAAGVSAMREAVVREFDRLGRQNVNAFACAKWVREMPGPDIG